MPQREPSEWCPHFGECGGCSCQDVPYPQQLERKERALRELFAAHWNAPIPVEPSPVIWHYRNRLDLHFAPKRYPEPPPEGFVRETVLGFKKKGRWYWPLEIDECRIGSDKLPRLVAAMREWFRAEGLRAFDSRTKQGLLKILLLREGKRTGERMVVLVTGDGACDKRAFVDAVLAAYPATSIYHAVYRGSADTAAGEEVALLYGADAITEILEVPTDSGTRQLRFRLSPFSFFQTNSAATERLYGKIRKWVQAAQPHVLYDLYGGAGGIAFSCADLVERVISVESVESASEDGVCNAAANGIQKNVEFVTQKMKNYLRELLAGDGIGRQSAVVVDPPRAGLHPKALARLMELRPPDILYVSCKPTVFARELPYLLESYSMKNLEAVDLFPHTDHVELLARLSLAD
ncbi:MAG TPA: 23S rRNA (uracil(1939)-C(5))-methyltransferase RlmD [Candidatus Hydrogenedentes bacterium]|nr:23S rRNA (uracil(1939)-C(5))-methyltransferase RlmD [Candidatus Hydrogenedentota bacterium]